jgi:predicted nuclease of predicted toxin-antitoxin system
VQFLVDAQLPPALARRIEALGHKAGHVADCDLASASDGLIRDHADRAEAVFVTKDGDFAVHRLLGSGSAVVWLRILDTRRTVLLQRVEADLPAIVAALERGETVIEIA